MDPDMVRQQEEEEAASQVHSAYRARPFLQPQSPAAAAASEAFSMDAAPPKELLAKLAPAAPSIPGWGAAIGATSYGLAFGGLGLAAGIMLGVKLQLVGWQGMLIGTGAGFLLGWRAAGSSLRRRCQLPARQAYMAPLGPMAVMLFLIIAAMLLKARFGGLISAETGLSDEQTHWAMISSGAFLGFVLALKRMRNALRR